MYSHGPDESGDAMPSWPAHGPDAQEPRASWLSLLITALPTPARSIDADELDSYRTDEGFDDGSGDPNVTVDPGGSPQNGDSDSNISSIHRRSSILESMLDSVEEAVVVVDNDDHLLEYNDRFLELWQIPQNLVDVASGDELWTYAEDQLEDPQAFRDRVERLRGDPTAVTQETVRFEGDRIVEHTSRPYKVDGEMLGRVWSFRDITERKESNRKLEESNEQLENFASLISHDLREPLRGVVTHLELLDRASSEQALGNDAQAALEAAMASADRSQEMVRGLHRLSSLDRGTWEPEVVSLTEVVQEAIAQLKGQIRDADATIEFGSMPTVKGDRSQLVTLFQNLIKNAIAHPDPAAPTVAIRTRPQTGGRLEVVVSDDGIGIPESAQEGIFEMFQTGGNGDGDNTGIGLTICRRIVERHGGVLTVESEADEGAKFCFSLPSADETQTIAPAIPV